LIIYRMFNTSLRYNFDRRIGNQIVSPNQQTPLRQGGFGGHFKDAPPPFIADKEKEDNKIERRVQPVKKDKTKKKKKKTKLLK
jgi:hypothetical protein